MEFSEAGAAVWHLPLIGTGALLLSGALAWVRRHGLLLQRVGGLFMVVVGVLLVTGLWDQVMVWLRAWLATTGLGSSVI